MCIIGGLLVCKVVCTVRCGMCIIYNCLSAKLSAQCAKPIYVFRTCLHDQLSVSTSGSGCMPFSFDTLRTLTYQSDQSGCPRSFSVVSLQLHFGCDEKPYIYLHCGLDPSRSEEKIRLGMWGSRLEISQQLAAAPSLYRPI